nr:hypothetical protein [uncultured Albidiferax sp.]
MSKQEIVRQLKEYLQRDLADARKSAFILGFKVWARDDWFVEGAQCPRAKEFAGCYLPDELPDLYPKKCPDKTACCCILHEFVFARDKTPEADILRKRMVLQGDTPPSSEEDPEVTPEAEAEIVRVATEELANAPADKKAVWEFVLGTFGKSVKK